MGAHGINVFDEDTAADWLADLCDHDEPIEFFKECLELEDVEYLELMESAGILGTCTMIDGLINGPTPDLPDEALDWLSANKNLKMVSRDLLPKAIQGLDAILGENCEIHELWLENDEYYPAWKQSIIDLRSRLMTVVPNL